MIRPIVRYGAAVLHAPASPVDQITPDVFKQRIQSMEQDALQKFGKPVRYQVQVNGREVQLLAVTS